MKMANFFWVIKMANIFLSKWRTFLISKSRIFFIKMANFVLRLLSKWRIFRFSHWMSLGFLTFFKNVDRPPIIRDTKELVTPQPYFKDYEKKVLSKTPKIDHFVPVYNFQKFQSEISPTPTPTRLKIGV